MNKMATTGARMLSVEEASRYAGGFDDPARLVSAFAGVAPSVSSNGISIHGNAPHLLQWRLEDVEIPNPNHFADIATLVEESFLPLAHRYSEIPISSPELFRLNMEMQCPACST